ncbi:MAG: O-acetyl-ADP-ribose deacetylase [Chloroflexi bacterium]|nr:O-acetyl-ADP-ribose deacetylase [Chloroflexota bacterium]
MDTVATVHASFGGVTVQLLQGDITTFPHDAIVNVANRSLLGGGGVDGAIHRVGGLSILEECRRLGGCPTGAARITGAGRLPARFVIHAVGPRWRSGRKDEAQLLASAYRSTLDLARDHGVTTVAFPAISTGAYRYPLPEAAGVALQTIHEFVTTGTSSIRTISFVLKGDQAFKEFQHALEKVVSG